MFSEPRHKQMSIKELHKFSVLNHLLSSYVATLALYSREHFATLPNFNKLEEIARNTEILIKEAIKIIEKSEYVVNENIQLLKVNKHQTEEIDESKILITEQFINIQKVTYDICKISERIKL
jgi:hypothetical protein